MKIAMLGKQAQELEIEMVWHVKRKEEYVGGMIEMVVLGIWERERPNRRLMNAVREDTREAGVGGEDTGNSILKLKINF